MATAIFVIPGAQAVAVSKPFLPAGQYSPTTTVDVTFNDPDLVSLAGLILHFDCSVSSEFSEPIGTSVGASSLHARIVGIQEVSLHGKDGYGYATQTGYGYSEQYGNGYETGNTGGVDLGAGGYSIGSNGYDFGYGNGYGYGYDSGTLRFTFAWNQAAFEKNEVCTLVVEIVPKGSVSGDFQGPRSEPFIPRVPPTANAGPDKVTVPGANFTLDGSASIDLNDGPVRPLLHTWTQLSGPTVSLTSQPGPDLVLSRANFTVPAALEQDLVFRLNVTDGLDWHTDDVKVTIQLVAAPDPAQILEGTPLTLNAQGAVLPGIAFRWTVDNANGPQVAFNNPLLLTPAITAPEVDDTTAVTLRLNATAGLLSKEVTVVITVLDNEAPVVDAGPEVELLGGVPALLDGAVVTDDEQTPGSLTYAWVELGQSPLLNLANGGQPIPTVTPTPVLTRTLATVQLTVTDDEGMVGIDVLDVIVVPGIPFANAGSDLGVIEGSTVTLSAAGSYLADDYEWDVPSGVTAPAVLDAADLTFTAPSVTGSQEFTFSVAINGGTGGSLVDTVKVTVFDAPAGGGNPNDWYLHTECVLVDAGVLILDATDTADHTASDGSDCLRPALPVLAPSNDFAATAVGTHGPMTVTGDLYLSVILPDTAPPALPVPGFDGLQLNVSLVQGATTLGSYEDTVDADQLAFGLVPELGIAYTPLSIEFPTDATLNPGAFAFRVTVAGGLPGAVYVIGVSGDAASVFTFPGSGGSGPGGLPVALASGPSIKAEGETVQLTASGSTAGTGVTYDWIQTGGPRVTLSGATTATPAFAAPIVAGDQTVSFLLTVTGANGLSARDSHALTIEDVVRSNRLPTAQAGPDHITAAKGDLVVLQGTAADADGDHVFGRWTQDEGFLVGGNAGASGDLGLSRDERDFRVPDVPLGTKLVLRWSVHDNVDETTLVHDTVTITVSNAGGSGGDPPTTPDVPGNPPTQPNPPPAQQPNQPQQPGQSQQPGQPTTPPTQADVDTDGDGIPDRIELLCRSDPRDAQSLCNFDITGLLTVEFIDGINHLSWRGLTVAMGYQVWSSNSPYVLLATVDGAGNTTFEDHSGTGKESTKYKLTFFVEKTKAGGYLADASQLDSLSGWDESSGTNSLDGAIESVKKVPVWGYLLMVCVALLVLAAITVYARFERTKK